MPPISGKRSADPLDDLGGRGDRVAGEEAAAGGQRALGAGDVAVDEVHAGQDAAGIGLSVVPSVRHPARAPPL